MEKCYNCGMKSQVIKTRNIPGDVLKNAYAVRVKPWALLLVTLFAGVAILIVKSYMIGLALPLVILTLFAILVMPDRILVQFSPEYMILYNRKDREECTLVYWDEVVSWAYEYHGACDCLAVILTDGRTEMVEMYSRRSIRRYMKLYAKGKEIKRRNNNAEKDS